MDDKIAGIDVAALAKLSGFDEERVRAELRAMSPAELKIAEKLMTQRAVHDEALNDPRAKEARAQYRAEVTAIVALHNALSMPTRLVILAEVIGLLLHADMPDEASFTDATPAIGPKVFDAMRRTFEAHRTSRPRKPEELIDWRERWMAAASGPMKQFGSFPLSADSAALNASAVARMRCVADGVSPSTPTNKYFEEPGGRLTEVRIGANDNGGETK